MCRNKQRFTEGDSSQLSDEYDPTTPASVRGSSNKNIKFDVAADMDLDKEITKGNLAEGLFGLNRRKLPTINQLKSMTCNFS